MEQLRLILFGWALGLLSPLIADFYRERKQREDFMTSARLELGDLQFILASTAIVLTMQHGRVTAELFEKAATVLDSYGGNEPIEEMREAVNRLRGRSQEEFDQLAAKKEDVGSSLKTMEPRYVMTNLSGLSKLRPDLQLRFYELFRTLAVINQEVSKVNALVPMTYDPSISEENHNRLKEDIQSKYVFIARQCERAVDKIERVVS